MDFTDGPDAVDAERHAFVYDRGGNVTSVVLIDGRAAGVWDVLDHHSETRFFPFVNPTYAVEERLWAELAAVGAVITGSAVRVTRLDLMAPLTGWVLKPLCTRDEVDQRLMRWISVLALRSPAVSPC
jgi:hypothetical protein